MALPLTTPCENDFKIIYYMSLVEMGVARI